MKHESKGEIIIYRQAGGKAGLEVKLQDETVWLSQMQMAELFGRDRSVITRHLLNVFKTKELNEKSNVQKIHVPFSDKPVTYYSHEDNWYTFCNSSAGKLVELSGISGQLPKIYSNYL